MKTAKLGRRQGVHLPREHRVEGDDVLAKRVGKGGLLLASTKRWDALIDSLDQFTDDFLADRRQPFQQDRAR